MYRNPESELHIRRLDAGSTHGFQFHIERGSVLVTRLFSDGPCGGKDIALERARSYRSRMVPKFPKSKRFGPRDGEGNSSSGVIGISIVEYPNADGSVRVYAQANARPPHGKVQNKKIRLEDDTDLDAAIKALLKWRKSTYVGRQA